jgi:hypothetical protein
MRVLKFWILTIKEHLQMFNSFTTFADAKIFRLPSSMDRISDSGSEDMGSNPVGVTTKQQRQVLLSSLSLLF